MRTNSGRFVSAPLALLIALGLLVGCSSDGSNNAVSSFLGTSALAESDGLMLDADPEEIVIDLGDPNTPIDPGTGKAYGTSDLKATVLDEAGEPMADAEVVFSADAGSLASQGNPVLTDSEGIAMDTLQVLVDDPDSIEVTATVDLRSVTGTVTKRVVQPNRPPVADAGEEIQAFCDSPEGATVTLDGSGSSDPDSTPDTNDDIVSFEWSEEQSLLVEGEVVQYTFGVGTHSVTLQVTDSGELTDSDETTVEVVDNAAPVVHVELSPDELWPPNHRMVDIQANVIVQDCSPVTITLLSVESNEPANDNGDGNTEPDILGVEAGSEDYHFQVRAERAGGGSGRVYTVTYLVVDDAGFESIAEATVLVPHDQGN